jgi:hypothetical protein
MFGFSNAASVPQGIDRAIVLLVGVVGAFIVLHSSMGPASSKSPPEEGSSPSPSGTKVQVDGGSTAAAAAAAAAEDELRRVTFFGQDRSPFAEDYLSEWFRSTPIHGLAIGWWYIIFGLLLTALLWCPCRCAKTLCPKF